MFGRLTAAMQWPGEPSKRKPPPRQIPGFPHAAVGGSDVEKRVAISHFSLAVKLRIDAVDVIAAAPCPVADDTLRFVRLMHLLGNGTLSSSEAAR